MGENEFRVIIAGGRDFTDELILARACDYYLRNKSNIVIISGGAKGADLLGEKYAKSRGFRIKRFEADWENINVPGAKIASRPNGTKYNKMAGLLRNEQMAQYANALIAFWDGKSRGTKDMIRRAEKHNLLVRVVKYNA